MKEIGVVRRLDDLGRITIPKEIRNKLGIGNRGELEIYMEQDKIVLKRYDSTKLSDQIFKLEEIIEEESEKLGQERITRMKTYLQELAKLSGD